MNAPTPNLPAPYSVSELETIADTMAKSGLFGVKRKEEALALMLVAQAQGIPAAQACVDFDIIQGKPAMTARAMLARFQQSGGVIKWKEYTDKACEAEFSHPQCPVPVSIRWSLEDAARAGLSGKQNWKSYPRQMLSSRVMSEGVDRCYPAASAGFYPPEVVRDFTEKDITPGSGNGLPSAPITPTSGAFDGIMAARQEIIMATAEQIKQKFALNLFDDAYALYEASNFDAEEKIACWSLLDSKIRGTLKRMHAAAEAAEKGTISEPQKKRMEAVIKEHGLDREKVKAWCKAQYDKEHFSDLTPAEYYDLEQSLIEMKKTKETA